MKQNFFSPLLLLMVSLPAFVGCSKDDIRPDALSVWLPANTEVWLPDNTAFLEGYYSGSNIRSFHWEKIDGPASYTFEDQNSLKTKVLNLVKGMYAFELTVTNKKGIQAKDTMNVWVKERYPAPEVRAAQDTVIQIPYNRAFLDFSSNLDPDQISSIEWKKTSGPDQYSIMNRYVGLYCVSNLTEGFYQFEVTVTDKFGRFARDTMTLTVRSDKNIYTNQEILFKDPIWSCPWGCTAELNNITSLIPAGKPFKVYVKATSANEWAIVVPADIYSKHPAEYLYENYYSIGNNTMFLYNDTESVSAGGMIKIVY